MQNSKIPISVIVTTRNEDQNLARCLAALSRFDEVFVVDSKSEDGTAVVAESFGVPVLPFVWNGQYPKKRQWCLDNLSLKHDRIFFVDADEEVTNELCEEVSGLDWQAPGYFVQGSYVLNGRALKYGLRNNKLCLFDRTKIEFPVVDDLTVPGMGEMEGHYQPVLKPAFKDLRIGQVKAPLKHHAFENSQRWHERHRGYAAWEAGMRLRNASFAEDRKGRSALKHIFRRLPFRPLAAFVHSYIIKFGFLDGRAGYDLARSRQYYYRLQAERRA